MNGGAHSSPSAALSFSDSKEVLIYCWVNRKRLGHVMQSVARLTQEPEIPGSIPSLTTFVSPSAD